MKRIFSLFHKLCEVHVVMNLITLLAIAQFFLKFDVWPAFLLLYLFISPLVSLTRAAYFVATGRPDAEFQKFITSIGLHKIPSPLKGRGIG
jgi:hypothetical protein